MGDTIIVHIGKGLLDSIHYHVTNTTTGGFVPPVFREPARRTCEATKVRRVLQKSAEVGSCWLGAHLEQVQAEESGAMNTAMPSASMSGIPPWKICAAHLVGISLNTRRAADRFFLRLSPRSFGQ